MSNSTIANGVSQADVALMQSRRASNSVATGKDGRPDIAKVRDMAHARKVAQDFEAFYLGQMLQPMFQGLELEEPFGGGNAEEMWRSMQVDEYGKAIAKTGGVGIADMVLKEILRHQEVE